MLAKSSARRASTSDPLQEDSLYLGNLIGGATDILENNSFDSFDTE